MSAVHIPGTGNSLTYRQSKVFYEHTEWSLSDTVFIQICKNFFYTYHKLFCISHLNHKADRYVSWHPDPGALPVAQLFYAFPPFSLITRMLQKGREDRAERCIVIVLLWQHSPGTL